MLSLNPHRVPGVLFLAAMAAVIANRARLVDAEEFLYLPYNGMDAGKLGKYGPYQKDDPLRQHLHLYQAPSEKPSPVYIYSHADGGHAALSDPNLKIIQGAGYSTISWESETVISTNTIENCWNDFELVWLWFKANAAKYNLDPNTVVIGGRSRGTLCSWPLAYSERPEIKGIYMYNVLPDMAWDENTQVGSSYVWDRAVTKNAPPTQLLYGPECPKPIEQNCITSPKKRDSHNPKHGQTIVDVYKNLGIGSRIQLTDGLKNNNINAHDLFPEFVAFISSSSTSKGSLSTKNYSFSTSKGGGGSSVTTASPSSVTTATLSSVTTATSSSVNIATSSSVTTATSPSVATATSSSVTTATSPSVATATSSSVNIANSSSPDAASATGHSGRKIFFNLFIISVCTVFAVFGYDKYYKKRRKRKYSHELNTDDGVLRMQDVGHSPYRDEDDELNTNDGAQLEMRII